MYHEAPVDTPTECPGVKGKIESVLTRLSRLKVEPGITVSDADESKRHTALFE